MPETVIRPAFAAQEVAQQYIGTYHEHLLDAKIQWLFTTAKSTRGGQVVLGTARRSNALQRFHSSGNESVQSGFDFVVQIEEKRWQTMLLTQKHALIDHLLCRMEAHEVVNQRTGNVTVSWRVVAPEIEEFVEVLERHGVWLPEQQKMAAVVRSGKQLKLTLPDVRGEIAEDDATKPSTTRSSRDEPERRVRTVAADSTVVDTQVSGPLDREPGETQFIVDDPHAPPTADGLLEVDPPATNGHGPTWQETTGTGTSDLEKHRSRRRAAGPPQSVPST